jgi:ribonuclease-3
MITSKAVIQFIHTILPDSPEDINIKLLMEALTHTSYATESVKPIPNNQRLEFLGDSILGMTIATQLYLDNPHFDEAQMTLYKISLVREECLYEVGKSIGLDKVIFIGKGEERKEGRNNPSIVWDAVEALIGYIYLEFGIKTVSQFILKHVYSKKDTITLAWTKGYKSLLQEKIQSVYKKLPVYTEEIIEKDDKLNYVKYKSTVLLGDKELGVGYGTSKKKAQEDAAKNALELL